MNLQEKFESILPSITDPSRYIGLEKNIVIKDPESYDFSVVLAFPDVYEIGMSHLGLKILHNILNQRKDVFCQRTFSPWPDMEEAMRREKIPLLTLETFRPVASCDLFGISLPYEMCYSTVLNLIDLVGIPLLAAERTEEHPLVLGGGEGTSNPEPVADFFDFFLVGDAEEALPEIVDTIKTARADGLDRAATLLALCKVTGVYVPSLYEVTYDGPVIKAVTPKSNVPSRIKKRILNNLEDASYPEAFLVPNMQIVHDRVLMEVMRGCHRGCRFCQAGIYYRPFRMRSQAKVEMMTDRLLTASGFSEISFNALSVNDYPPLEKLVEKTKDRYKRYHVSISLPSMRMNDFSVSMAERLSTGKKVSLTFAPEAGSQRLRNVINKNISEDDIFNTILNLAQKGWRRVKLYFMIDLPTETDEDILAITDLIRNIKWRLSREHGIKGFHMILNISNFVPKAQTPFQWESQSPLEVLQKRQKSLVGNYKGEVRWSDPKISILEGVFARGDRRLSKVLLAAQKEGCRLDTWTSHFNYEAWCRAFESCELDPMEIVARKRDFDEVMPWDHIDLGVRKDYLLAEAKKAYQAETSPSCLDEECQSCGLEDACAAVEPPSFEKEATGLRASNLPFPKDAAVTIQKIRLRYTKTGLIRFVSHLNQMRIFFRAFARLKLPLAYSKGFNPHPRVIFHTSLPVGTESRCELLDINLIRRIDPHNLMARLNRELPEGLSVSAFYDLPPKAPPLTNRISSYEYTALLDLGLLSAQKALEITDNWRILTNNIPLKEPHEIEVLKKGKKRTIDLASFLSRANLIEREDSIGLKLIVNAFEGKTVKPSLLLEHIFKIDPDLINKFLFTRMALTLND